MSINRPKGPEALGNKILSALAAIGITFATTGEVNAQADPTAAPFQLYEDALEDALTALADKDNITAEVSLEAMTRIIKASSISKDEKNKLKKLIKELRKGTSRADDALDGLDKSSDSASRNIDGYINYANLQDCTDTFQDYVDPSQSSCKTLFDNSKKAWEDTKKAMSDNGVDTSEVEEDIIQLFKADYYGDDEHQNLIGLTLGYQAAIQKAMQDHPEILHDYYSEIKEALDSGESYFEGEWIVASSDQLQLLASNNAVVTAYPKTKGYKSDVLEIDADDDILLVNNNGTLSDDTDDSEVFQAPTDNLNDAYYVTVSKFDAAKAGIDLNGQKIIKKADLADNIGRKVEVVTSDGKVIKGTLSNANPVAVNDTDVTGTYGSNYIILNEAGVVGGGTSSVSRNFVGPQIRLGANGALGLPTERPKYLTNLERGIVSPYVGFTYGDPNGVYGGGTVGVDFSHTNDLWKDRTANPKEYERTEVRLKLESVLGYEFVKGFSGEVVGGMNFDLTNPAAPGVQVGGWAVFTSPNGIFSTRVGTGIMGVPNNAPTGSSDGYEGPGAHQADVFIGGGASLNFPIPTTK